MAFNFFSMGRHSQFITRAESSILQAAPFKPSKQHAECTGTGPHGYQESVAAVRPVKPSG